MKEFLSQAEVDFQVRNPDEDPLTREELWGLMTLPDGRLRTPITVFEDRVILGYDRGKLSEVFGPQEPRDSRPKGPSLAVDALVDRDGKILLIERRNPPEGWALPGGFVEYGEPVEEAVQREIREETGLILENLKQFHVYSDPGRDDRGHIVSVCFTARARGELSPGTDALRAKWFSLEDELPKLAFDHRRILDDYQNAAGRGNSPG